VFNSGILSWHVGDSVRTEGLLGDAENKQETQVRINRMDGQKALNQMVTGGLQKFRNDI